MENNKDLRIFIIDDDIYCRHMYKEYLLCSGYQRVHVFEEGDDCLQNLFLQPDVIIIDYNMKPYNGIDLLRKIKATNPDAYLLLISGQKEIPVAVNALRSGAYHYISKDENMLCHLGNTLHEIKAIMQASPKLDDLSNLYNNINCN